MRLFEATSGRLKRTFFSSPASLRVVAFSPDGKRLAAGSDDKKVYLWEVESRGQPTVFADHQTPVDSLRWLEDGQTLVSGSRTEVHVRQIPSGKLLRTVKTDGGAISPSGTLIASRGPSTVRLYQTEDGRLLRTIVALQAQSHLTLSPGIGPESLPSLDDELVYVIQTETGQETLTPDEFAERSGVGL